MNQIKTVLKNHTGKRLIVFCTYQSLIKIKEAQEDLTVPDFDLTIVMKHTEQQGLNNGSSKKLKQDQKAFTLIHNQEHIRSKKRLYMTATPKVYHINVRNRASHLEQEIYSMDDEAKYGKELYKIGFAEAVNKGILSDYQVIILSVFEDGISKILIDDDQRVISKETGLDIKNAAKIIGCNKAIK